MANQQKMLGFETPGDKKVAVRVRDWTALKLALWRSKRAWDIVIARATEIIDRCEHTEDCPALENETGPCSPDFYSSPEKDEEGNVLVPGVITLSGCPDRETRMDARVILNAAKEFAPVNAVARANEPFVAPSREYFSEVMTELVTTQLENEALRKALAEAGIEVPAPPPNATPALPTPRKMPQLIEGDTQ